MITLAWYLLKVMICSGILCGYYYLALRNKIFHRWNRFYLLASIIISLLVPVIKINFFKVGEDKSTVIKMLQTINTSDEIIIEYSRHKGIEINSENMLVIGYILISLSFLAALIWGLKRIKQLRQQYPFTRFGRIHFFSTDAKGTPFSFFSSIFWNTAIDLHSSHGQQIFNHELAHVNEKHSYDKMGVNLLLILFWINPFFWIIKKELGMIHEFIADKEALEDSDINAFAEMVLQTVYPGRNFSLTNNYFHSPIKRRIIMFTKNKNPKVSYISRILVLPLIAILFFAFTIKTKNIGRQNQYNGKKIIGIIDTTHGGDNDGAIVNNAIKEKDINFAMPKEIASKSYSHSAGNSYVPNTTNTSKPNDHVRLDDNIVVENRIKKNPLEADTFIRPKSPNKSSNTKFDANSTILPGSDTDHSPIYFVDGKEISKQQMGALSPAEIYSISVLKDESSIAVYGDKGKNGVILITTKKDHLRSTDLMHTNGDKKPNSISLNDMRIDKGGTKNATPTDNKTDTIPDKVFTKVENEASFPGGQEAWIKYIISKIQTAQDSLTNKDFGTCLLKFIVNTDGSISNVEATTMKNSKLAEVAINAVRTGPKWIPATQNGHTVAAYRLQPITLTDPERK